MSQIFQCNLKFDHQGSLLHCTKERTKWFTGLEIYRTILHLDYYVIGKLAVEGHKLIVCLHGPVAVGGLINEGPPHDHSIVGFEHACKHIGTILMGTAEVHRTGLTFGIGLYKEAPKVGYHLVNLSSFVPPPLLYILIKWIGCVKSSKNCR